jgi:hypothetical protein
MMHDPKDQQFWLTRLDMSIAMLDAMALHGLVCLALQHPSAGADVRKRGELLRPSDS